MPLLENPKIKFLFILPIIAGIIYFGTTIMESGLLDETATRERILSQFAINYESMINACSEDDLNSKEVQSCLDAFEEVKEFCLIESAEQCGDDQMKRLEEKLSDI